MDAVSSLLNGRPGRRPVGFGPDLLPVLQGVCGQVTQLRIEDSSSATAATGEERSCCRSLEQRVERRMEEMEERLKRHIDRRLEALEQRLERASWRAAPGTRPRASRAPARPDWNARPRPPERRRLTGSRRA
ncbi:hypothetical protein ANANG_G00048350 [Anguilla anguilla]|uniref:Uncharacterized protein n=1 Tax=Anguilla anguilla TaxID=7936 RepID=A0A9D3MYI0_ANGAN|nr:hypothetical protein ANANG_G00048350 [Anguilla anguilla]